MSRISYALEFILACLRHADPHAMADPHSGLHLDNVQRRSACGRRVEENQRAI